MSLNNDQYKFVYKQQVKEQIGSDWESEGINWGAVKGNWQQREKEDRRAVRMFI